MIEKKNIQLINDPVHGFIPIETPLISAIISHSFFQRLRRIKQLGVTDFVYPSANHTRFHHALGAMKLMINTLNVLQKKGVQITEEEREAACIAILLHDLGHSPFSHVLEQVILPDIQHEELSLLLMKKLNEEFGGKLERAIKIFTNTYDRIFFFQLVSSQLDMDRLDYLQRDSFFTGVYEGKIGVDRIINVLDVREDKIVVEKKGIYSIEHFLNARRIMYWQVYLNKTNIATQQMLVQLIRRAKELRKSNNNIFVSSALAVFFDNEVTGIEGMNEMYIQSFAELDDHDIWICLKEWKKDKDYILRMLSEMLVERNLFKTEYSDDCKSKEYIKKIREKVMDKYGIPKKDIHYFVCQGVVSNAAYTSSKSIKVLDKKGNILTIEEASDLPYIKALGKIVRKYYVSYPYI